MKYLKLYENVDNDDLNKIMRLFENILKKFEVEFSFDIDNDDLIEIDLYKSINNDNYILFFLQVLQVTLKKFQNNYLMAISTLSFHY